MNAILLFALSVATLLSFESSAQTSMVVPKTNAYETKPKQPVTEEQVRMDAIKKINAWASSMKVSDPDFSSKEYRIMYAIPIIHKHFPPSLWETQIRFLYSALTEMDNGAKLKSPDAVLSRYYEDESRRAPDNVQNLNGSVRTNMVESRLDVLAKQFQEEEIGLSEHAARSLAVALVYFPYDQRFIGLRRYRLELVLQLERGEIDRQKFDMLWDIKRREFNAGSVQNRQAEAAQLQAIEAQRNAESGKTFGNILGAAARGMQNAVNSMPTPPVTCTTIANITTCR